jgi:hypothetical protein
MGAECTAHLLHGRRLDVVLPALDLHCHAGANDVADDERAQRRVLRALGFQATVDKDAEGRLVVEAELRLAAGQPGLWFVSEDEQRQWDAGFAQVLGRKLRESAGQPPDQELLEALGRGEPLKPAARVPAEVGQVRFVTATSSPCP